MGMGFQQPLHLQPVFANERDDPVGLGAGGAPRGRVVVEHGVDDCALTAIGFIDHVTVGRGGRVEEGFNQGGHGGCFCLDEY